MTDVPRIDIATVLAERGYRVTPQRVAIYEFLAGNASHPSADEIFGHIQRHFPMVSPATVYKTLELFTRLGVIGELGFGHGPVRYDGNPHTHINLKCVNCERIFDIDADILSEVANRATRSGFQVLGGRHEFFGVCPECQHARGAGDAATTARAAGDGATIARATGDAAAEGAGDD